MIALTYGGVQNPDLHDERPMKQRGRAIIHTLLALVCFFSAAACSGQMQLAPKHPARTQGNVTVEELRARSESNLKKAIFYKPSEDSADAETRLMAPLIVQAAEDRAAVGFGTLRGEWGNERLDREPHTVYYGKSTIALGSHQLDQWMFFWRYPSDCDFPKCVSCAGRGVRFVLGVDGLPIFWEALSTDDHRSVLFVSRSLEEAARREFGVPLPGRAFAIETDTTEARHVIVTRLLDDASVAMGPFVYLEPAPQGDILTPACRCMPSQADEFVETRTYRLEPIESLERNIPHSGCGLGWPYETEHKVLWRGTLTEMDVRGDRPWLRKLDGMLRWPREYR